MTSNTKLFHKQLKTLIPSMSWKELKKLFESYTQTVGEMMQYSCKEMSYKCFECNLGISGKKASGYGRCDQEAYCNSIKNILQILIEQEDLLSILRHCMKKINDPLEQSTKQNQPRKSLSIKPHISTIVSLQNNENKKSRSHLKSAHESLNLSLLKSTTNKTTTDLELQAAKIKISHLEHKIRTLEQQNKYLKQKSSDQHNQNIPNIPNIPVLSSSITSSINIPVPTSYSNHSDYDLTRLSLGPKHTQSHSQHQKLNSSVQQIFKKQSQTKKSQGSKMKVPRLKLQILPNFHGKSNKSINHSFLACQQALGK